MPHQVLRALVIDDEPTIASTLATILRLNGFSAISYTDSVKALESALMEPPDLIISDIVMPRLSGIDLAMLIREFCPTCKVLLFSGQAETIDFLQDAQRLTAELHVIPKPVHPSALLAVIRQKLAEN